MDSNLDKSRHRTGEICAINSITKRSGCRSIWRWLLSSSWPPSHSLLQTLAIELILGLDEEPLGSIIHNIRCHKRLQGKLRAEHRAGRSCLHVHQSSLSRPQLFLRRDKEQIICLLSYACCYFLLALRRRRKSILFRCVRLCDGERLTINRLSDGRPNRRNTGKKMKMGNEPTEML